MKKEDVPRQGKGVKQDEEGGWAGFQDPRIGQRKAERNKRRMKFHDAGIFQAEAQRLRMKTQLEKLQSEISSIARKTGISSATQLAKLVPKGRKNENKTRGLQLAT